MAKESFKIGDGDKVVLRDPKFWLCGNGIWTVTEVTQYSITVRRRVNGETQSEFVEEDDIKRKIQKGEQIMMFHFLYN